jgi:sterol 14alpha-demethylase
MGLVTGGLSTSSFQLLILMTTFSVVILAVLLNVLKQILFSKKDEPPVVFHWFPFIGSAVSYGQEPTEFLKECQAKV